MLLNKKSFTAPELQWFKESRIGMVVHFGLYAIPARGEHLLNNAKIPRLEYEKLRAKFNPCRFNANAWVDAAEAMGARYIVITAKHLDGFCLFDSRLTDYKITNTPWGRDLVGELTDACHRRKMRIIYYYSRADWHHRNYVHDPEVMYSLSHDLSLQKPDWSKYMKYFIGQLKELCVNYGQVDGFWFDAYGPSYDGEPSPGEVYRMIKRLQPGAVINDRNEYGDFFTPERSFVNDLSGCLLESCDSLGIGEWGYETDPGLYTAPYLIKNIVHCAGHGSNYLINFGPAADGTLPPDRVKLAQLAGRWLKHNAEAIYGTDRFPAESNAGGNEALRGCTAKIYATSCAANIYILLPEWPHGNRIIINSIHEKPHGIELFDHDGKVNVEVLAEGLMIRDLPLLPPQMGANVIKLSFHKAPPAPRRKKRVFPAVLVDAKNLTVLAPDTAQLEGRSKKGALLDLRWEPVDSDKITDISRERIAPGTRTKPVLTEWRHSDQQAIWHISLQQSVTGLTSIDMRCPARFAGSGFTVKAAGQELRGTVAPSPLRRGIKETKPLWWWYHPEYKFRRHHVGILKLPKGTTTITLQAIGLKQRFHFADVGHLRITPLKQAGA